VTNHTSSSLSGEVEAAHRVPRLSVSGVNLTLGNRQVLKDVSFDASVGEIVGLLGPNGSGKTSLLRCLTGLVLPEQGEFRIHGESVGVNRRRLRETLGVVFQDASLDNHLKAIENLELGGRLFGMSRRDAGAKARELLKFVELADRAEDLTKTFSGGMRRRLELARALIHSPKLVLLDEPTTGLDPIALEKIWKRLVNLRESTGLTIVVSTHRADEAERCDKLIVMDRGHVIAEASPKELMARVSGEIITLVTSDPESLGKKVEAQFHVHARLCGARSIEIEVDEAHLFIPRLVEAFPVGTFESLSMRRPTIADAFFQLTGHSLDEETGEAE